MSMIGSNNNQASRRSTTPRRIIHATTGTIATLIVATVTATVTATTAHADPTADTWARLRACESGGNYSIASGNGYYGAYQFDLGTWASVGGTGQPNQATPAEQDYRALYLYRMRGWQPWGCARGLGLTPDADAASKRIPTTDTIATPAATTPAPTAVPTAPSTPATPSTTPPPWPGRVYHYGNCAAALRTWQLRMNVFGYHFEGTGCYYAKTRAAVLALQRANGIHDSGLLGPQTWRAAWTGTAPIH